MGRHPLAFRFLGVAGARRSARDQCSPQRTANLSRAVREIHIHSLRWDQGRRMMSRRTASAGTAAAGAASRHESETLAPRDPVIEPDELSLLAAFRLLDARRRGIPGRPRGERRPRARRTLGKSRESRRDLIRERPLLGARNCRSRRRRNRARGRL
ncbi:hypothetical protein MES4922_190019 [Mesorhizobium ventifaucium]|uniref:DUF1403 family protein n=1 Tax=Mesorhizobium ventifaucium TaxID=666020 RepID=A0ABM9DKK8_9HYPH|nr:hypothetical protein MES4922_190019 [Mesorhizobium ventifaucium]